MPAGRLLQSGKPDLAGLTYPVAVKAVHDALPHKTEAGAVVLNAADGDAVIAAMASIKNNVARHSGDIVIGQFLVEEMVDGAVLEMIAGIHRDPVFGLTMTLGAGGVLVELIEDTASLLLPATAVQIRHALQKLRCHRLLTGYRGGARGDIAALVTTLLALSAFAEAWSERLEELDINPLFVLPEGKGVVAGDALIRARPNSASS
jgi:succinyl-CoA synthetase beta subunit